MKLRLPMKPMLRPRTNMPFRTPLSINSVASSLKHAINKSNKAPPHISHWVCTRQRTLLKYGGQWRPLWEQSGHPLTNGGRALLGWVTRWWARWREGLQNRAAKQHDAAGQKSLVILRKYNNMTDRVKSPQFLRKSTMETATKPSTLRIRFGFCKNMESY